MGFNRSNSIGSARAAARKSPSGAWRSAALAALLVTPLSCVGADPAASDDRGDDEAWIERSTEALTINSDSFVYFLCNSTGHTPSESNRLKSTQDPSIFKLSYTYDLSYADSCYFLQTNQLNDWGTTQSRFTDRSPSTPLGVPASDALTPGSQTFGVSYPATGPYELTVNWPQQTFSIGAPSSLITGRVTVPTAAGGGWGVSGVTVSLTGPTAASALTDANGVYRFRGLPAGAYTVSVAKSGATFAASSAAVQVESSSIQDFTCDAPCGNNASIDPARELVITHPAVVNDWRSSSAANGPWSFRFLLEQMTPPGVDPATFAQGWLNQFLASSSNGFAVAPRNPAALTGGTAPLWPSVCDAGGQSCKLDLARAPFKLLAIVNRADLHAAGSGEGRLVYGLDVAPDRPQMTVIFEYELPSSAALPDRAAWVSKFHALSSAATPLPSAPNTDPALPSSPYVVALQDITDRFTRAAVVPSTPQNPLGSALIDLRTSESALATNGTWEWREFRLAVSPAADPARCNFVGPCLTLAPNAQTPDDGLNAASFRFPSARIQELAAWIMTNGGADVYGGLATVPASYLAGTTRAPDPPPWGFSNTPTPTPENIRHAFGGQTCNGCHTSEALPSSLSLDFFYHITPQRPGGPDGTAILSPFVTTIEIPRRVSFALSVLGCGAGPCPVGGESMMGPQR